MLRFYYSALNDREKGVYDAVYSAFLNGRSQVNVDLRGMTVKRLQAVLDSVLDDHPEFCCDGKSFEYEYTPGSIIFKNPVYSIYKDEKYSAFWKSFAEQIKTYCKTDFEKVKYVHDFMINTVTYDREDMDNASNHNALGTFRTSKGVCEGIARLTQFLLRLGGVRAVYCEGKLNECEEDETENADKGQSLEPGKEWQWWRYRKKDQEILHAWTVAEVEGRFYYLDVSHDICLTAERRHGSYRYFMLTHDELLQDRCVTEDAAFRKLTCGAVSHYYFRQIGNFVTSMDQLKGLLDATVKRACDNRKRGMSVQFKVDGAVRGGYLIPFHKICITTACEIMKRRPNSYEYKLLDYDDGMGIYHIEFTAL